MPWRMIPKKDVAGYEMPRGAAKQALIRGCPNGETHLKLCWDTINWMRFALRARQQIPNLKHQISNNLQNSKCFKRFEFRICELWFVCYLGFRNCNLPCGAWNAERDRLTGGYSANWNILLAEGKESKRYSLSSGERTGKSLNQIYF
jgi:hypothetical protein